MPARRLHTFVFADLAGFTALTEAMGDEDAASLAGAFCASARALLAEHRAEEIKTIGDALMIRGDEPHEAVRLGVRLVSEVGGTHYFRTVRVGMHSGSAVRRDGDWFGSTVNIAARVSGLARGGEVLVTRATHDAAGELADVAFAERGRHELKNVGEPVELYAALGWRLASDSSLPIDPVCRMAVDPAHAAGTATRDGRTYHFCSLKCLGRFAAHPERYAAGSATA